MDINYRNLWMTLTIIGPLLSSLHKAGYYFLGGVGPVGYLVGGIPSSLRYQTWVPWVPLEPWPGRYQKMGLKNEVFPFTSLSVFKRFQALVFP